jgi:hypothetical protein
VSVAVTSVVRLDNGTVQAAVRGQVSSFPELLAAMVNSTDLLAVLDEAQKATLMVSCAVAWGTSDDVAHAGMLHMCPCSCMTASRLPVLATAMKRGGPCICTRQMLDTSICPAFLLPAPGAPLSPPPRHAGLPGLP